MGKAGFWDSRHVNLIPYMNIAVSIRACLCSHPAWHRRFQISIGKLILIEDGQRLLSAFATCFCVTRFPDSQVIESGAGRRHMLGNAQIHCAILGMLALR